MENDIRTNSLHHASCSIGAGFTPNLSLSTIVKLSPLACLLPSKHTATRGQEPGTPVDCLALQGLWLEGVQWLRMFAFSISLLATGMGTIAIDEFLSCLRARLFAVAGGTTHVELAKGQEVKT